MNVLEVIIIVGSIIGSALFLAVYCGQFLLVSQPDLIWSVMAQR